MATKVKPIPDGYHSITPYLIINGAARALDFYKKAFGAKEQLRIPGQSPDKIGHAEIRIGDSVVMLADEHPQMGARSPQALGGSPVGILLYVENVDGVVKQAVAAGAKIKSPVEDKFYGDRMAGLEDPFGHVWYIATHQEDVPPDEMQRRAAAMCAGPK